MTFVPKSLRNASFIEEDDSEEERKREIQKKRESTKIAKSLANQKFVDEKPKIVPFKVTVFMFFAILHWLFL